MIMILLNSELITRKRRERCEQDKQITDKSKSGSDGNLRKRN
jgi:hypothetical protein